MAPEVALFLTTLVCCTYLTVVVNDAAPEPYMDEIFHQPQTKQWCGGDFVTWDPKLTTLPGLYVFGLAHATVLAKAVSLGRAIVPSAFSTHAGAGGDDGQGNCSVQVLRFVNPVFSALSSVILLLIIRRLYPRLKTREAVLAAAVGTLHPLHFFYSVLYYTDVGSTLFVLLTYYFSLKNQRGAAALSGLVSVLFRQTNIVWVGFFWGASLLRRAELALGKSEVDHDFRDLIDVVQHICCHLWTNFKQTAPTVALMVSFVAFVKWNGGIVVGDRDAHQAVVHLAQLFYFGAFTVALLGPVPLLHGPGGFVPFLRSLTRRWGWPVAVGLVMYAVSHYSVVHPYLLADNRHYTFYVWRIIISRFQHTMWAQAGVALVYCFCGWSVDRRLAQSRGWVWRAGFYLSTAVTLVPAGLLEFRYFTVPYLLVFLHSIGAAKVSRVTALVLSLLVLGAVNAFCLYIFVQRPFYWPDGSVARFMW